MIKNSFDDAWLTYYTIPFNMGLTSIISGDKDG
jgi:hypothetical protein